MIVAFVPDYGGSPVHYFPTWAQAEAFAAAVGLEALTTTAVDKLICVALGFNGWAPVHVVPGASPPEVWDDDFPVVGADWLDATFGGES